MKPALKAKKHREELPFPLSEEKHPDIVPAMAEDVGTQRS